MHRAHSSDKHAAHSLNDSPVQALKKAVGTKKGRIGHREGRIGGLRDESGTGRDESARSRQDHAAPFSRSSGTSDWLADLTGERAVTRAWLETT
jgi:hypothetical protein